MDHVDPTTFAPYSGPGAPFSSLAGARPAFGVFDINITLTAAPGLGASQLTQVQDAFSAAELFWESRILGYESQELADAVANIAPVVEIDASVVNIDGAGNVLAQAGATSVIATNGLAAAPDPSNVIVSTGGIMQFDFADIDSLLGGIIGDFGEVVRHEMAHVLGFTDFFWDFVAATDGSGSDASYTGAFGLHAYQQEFDPGAAFVPIETGGGPGTAFGHWDENDFANHFAIFGNSNNPELMTGFLDSPTYLSNTTLASFDDLGYVTTATQPIPVPLASVLLLTGLGALGWAGRRRTA